MRRIAFIIIFPTLFLLSTPLLLIGFMLGKINKKYQLYIAYLFTNLLSNILMYISGVTFVVSGVDNIPKNDTVLFVGNHKSMLDIPALIKHVNFPIAFIGKKSLRKVPFLSWWMILLDCLFLDRENPKNALKSIIRGIEKLNNNESLVIFPEGTRSKTNTILPFKKGSLKLATKSNVTIVPFAIKGTDKVFENNGLNLVPNTICLSFGTPLKLDESRKDNHEYLHSIVEKMYLNF